MRLHFEFTGRCIRPVTLTIAESTLNVEDGLIGKPDLHIRADSDTWIGMLNQEISLVRAFITGGLKIKGNPMYLKRFKGCLLQ